MSDASPREFANTTAVVLVGGVGSRLRPVVSDRPKPLAPVGGRPVLAYLLDQLVGAGVRRIVLSTGYLGEQIEAAFGAQFGPAQLIYSLETQPLGTGGALRLALEKAGVSAEPILALNGDSFCHANLQKFAVWHRTHAARASLLLAQVGEVSRFGCVEVEADGHIKDFQEKGARRGQGWINAGIYLLAPELLMSLEIGQSCSLERELFPRWIGQGFFGFQSQGAFLDIGTPDSYAQAEAFFGSLKPTGISAP